MVISSGMVTATPTALSWYSCSLLLLKSSWNAALLGGRERESTRVCVCVFYTCVQGYSLLLGVLLLIYPKLINHPIPEVTLHHKWMSGFECRVLCLEEVKNGQGVSKVYLSYRVS